MNKLGQTSLAAVKQYLHLAQAEGIEPKLLLNAANLPTSLLEEGSHYQQILDKERQIRAEFLLSNSHYSLSEISHQMGFTETSSFSRSFKSWTGMTPGEFKQQAQSEK